MCRARPGVVAVYHPRCRLLACSRLGHLAAARGHPIARAFMMVLGCMHALLLATANTELDVNGRTAMQHGAAKAQWPHGHRIS